MAAATTAQGRRWPLTLGGSAGSARCEAPLQLKPLSRAAKWRELPRNPTNAAGEQDIWPSMAAAGANWQSLPLGCTHVAEVVVP